MKRTFFAIEIRPDQGIISVLDDIRNTLAGEKIKWVARDRMHLTLKFLGDTPEDALPQIILAAKISFAKIPVMALHLFSLGIFKNLHNPRVIWIGIRSCPPLEEAAKILGDAMSPFGYPVDPVTFVPHLTLGRIKDIRYMEKLSGLLAKYRDVSFGTASVKEVTLFESILHPEGPEYLTLAEFPLQDRSDA